MTIRSFKIAKLIRDKIPAFLESKGVVVNARIMEEQEFISSLKDKLLEEARDLEYSPHGYNIGANCGEIAGQSVMHLHLHLIPRYRGDMEDPKKGGVRGVIPSKQKY